MATGDTQNAIHWPERYLPGTTDNFVTNEVIVEGLSHRDIWPLLADTSKWTSYYDNASDPVFPRGDGPTLHQGSVFSFSTFGSAPLDAEVVEYAEPGESAPGRLSWTAKQGGSVADAFDVLHCWLIEDLPADRVRILTQESQIGEPAAQMARQKPSPLLIGHQAWLDGLVAAANTGKTAT
jgi:hypothetical protein